MTTNLSTKKHPRRNAIMPQLNTWVTMEISDPENGSTWDSEILLLLNTGCASDPPVAAPYSPRRKMIIALALLLSASIALIFSIAHDAMPLGMVAIVTMLLAGRELLPGDEPRAHNGLKRPAVKEWLDSNKGHIIVLNTATVCPMGHGSTNIWGREGREAELAARLQRLLPALPDTEEVSDLLDAAVSNITLKAELEPLTSLGAAACQSPSREPSIRATAAAHLALKAEHKDTLAKAEEYVLRLDILAQIARAGITHAPS